MGCQGEIFNVYGVVVDAKLVWEGVKEKPPTIYSINGFCVSHSDQYDFEEDIFDKFSPQDVGIGGDYGTADLKNKPHLGVRILGHSFDMGSRHFDGKALLGYTVANESYEGSSTELPPINEIQALAPDLIKDIKKEFDIDIKEEDLRLHLVFDFINGF